MNLTYRDGENERQWLATANSNLRSDMLVLLRYIEEMTMLVTASVDVMKRMNDGFVSEEEYDSMVAALEKLSDLRLDERIRSNYNVQ